MIISRKLIFYCRYFGCSYRSSEMASLDNDVLPVWYCTDLKYVEKDHCLYRMVYSLTPGEQVYVIIGDARYMCSRHELSFTRCCKEYDINIRYRKFDAKDFVWKEANADLSSPLKNIWIVPFNIRFIDSCMRNRYQYGFQDGIQVYHSGCDLRVVEHHDEDDLTKIVPWDEAHNRSIHSKNRRYNVNPCGSEDFLEDIK